MSTVLRLQRSVTLTALVCAVLMTLAGVAFAASGSPTVSSLKARELSYSSYGTADTSRAFAHEQYLGTYGEPQPQSPAQSPTASDDTPWLPITLSISGALVIAAASATQLRRLRLRRRHAARSTA
jgi:hypothetical protein